ncbi:uncharacterized protein LOC109860510 [Pseudomyrmex gracilis]|uniref:uncharacterized protein LOC109860510 n=1 Tax=Pseudomyrmex gracilis TaxID=219809 RepID=UPI000994E7AA|nr:uncharacterized protein LOC109860510 [Pseudomyrmex gracilis]
MSHFERHVQMNLLSFQDPQDSRATTGRLATTNQVQASSSTSDDAVSQKLDRLTQHMMQLQEVLTQFVTFSVDTASRRHTNQHTESVMRESVPVPGVLRRSLNESRSPVLASLAPAQAVKLLSSQIPDFKGSEDEDVSLWIENVEQVARIHGVSEDVTLLAATVCAIRQLH